MKKVFEESLVEIICFGEDIIITSGAAGNDSMDGGNQPEI